MTSLLVIGSPSLDIIHIHDKTFETVGGAGMYLAMAARRSGVKVSMFGPRPGRIPDQLKEFAGYLEEWIGPEIPVEEIPRFEISHNGDKAEYILASVASESGLDLSTLPRDLSAYDAVHITAMGDSRAQMEYYREIRSRGARVISMGTWLRSIKANPTTACQLVDLADIFFMNAEEAQELYGSTAEIKGKPGQLLVVTQAENGATLIQGETRTRIPTRRVTTVDPTGAGESFCGATLANILLGLHPALSAMRGAMMAAEKIEDIGPRALMRKDPPPSIPLDKRVSINPVQVKKTSKVVKDLPAADPFGFVGEYLPAVGDPHALDYFFAVTLQQFSFWEESNGFYRKPLNATIGGRERKGSTYMYYAFMKPLKEDPDFYSPGRQAQVTTDEMAELFRADDGSVQMPALELHVQQANRYGHDMLALGLTPEKVVQIAMDSDRPLQTFVMTLDHIGGYKEDPVRKKSDLLALSISQRPEKFLKFGKIETVSPVVDYHCMRSVLRIGLVDVLDDDLRQKLADRRILQSDEEWAVRWASYHIQEQVEAQSGKPIGAVDWFFFNYMRSHCPEMTDPVCEECAMNLVCAKRKEMFQPVLRTSFY